MASLVMITDVERVRTKKNAVQKLQVAHLHANTTVSAQDMFYKGTSAQQVMFGIYNMRSDIVNVISFIASRSQKREEFPEPRAVLPSKPEMAFFQMLRCVMFSFSSYLMPLRA